MMKIDPLSYFLTKEKIRAPHYPYILTVPTGGRDQTLSKFSLTWPTASKE